MQHGESITCQRFPGQPDRALINELWEAWPEIRQLIEGWATTTPKEEWSEWDEKVRQLTIQFSFKLEDAHQREAGYSQNEDTRILDWIEKQGDIFSIVVDPDLGSLRINYSKWQSNVKSLRDAILSVMREAGFEKGEG